VLKNLWLPIWAARQSVDVHLYLAPPCSYTELARPQVCYIFDVPRGEDNRRLIHRLFNIVCVRLSAVKADRIMALSETTRREICRVYRVNEARVDVVPPCLNLEVFHSLRGRPELKSWLEVRGLKPGYILGVISRMVPRKNPRAYVEAYARLKKSVGAVPPLVLVGPNSTKALLPFVSAETLAEVGDSLVCLGKIEDAERPCAYSGAALVLFLSRHEGFGLPIVESLACGTRVVASDIPACREAAGRLCSLVNPEDFDAIAEGCCKILRESATGRDYSAGVKWAARFGYREFAERTVAILEKVIQEWYAVRKQRR